jgi:hypothetical protein
MALQLRRGTNAERAAETFAVGELIYTTDTKQIYVGDGSTQGGVLVSSSAASSPASLTQNLSLNGFNISGTGNISATAFVGDGSGLTGIASGAGVEEGQEYSIDIQGNVRGDDTTVLVDAALGRVSADHYGDGSNLTGITLNQLSNVDTTGVTTNSILKYDGADWVIGVDNNSGGGIGSSLTGDLDLNNNKILGTGDIDILGYIEADTISGNLLATDSTVMINAATRTITASTITGSLIGDVRGSVFGDDSSVIIDAVNNTITGTITSATIAPDNQQLTVASGIPTAEMTLKVNADNARSNLRLTRETTSDLTGDTSSQYGAILFERNDANGELATSVIFGRENSLYFGNSSDGVLNTGSKYFVWKDNKFGIGITSPTEQLDVAGNAKIDGFVQTGSLTTTERNALTAANGMILYNSTTNQLESYENGAWAATGGAGGGGDVVDDTTPQLGGNLDLNSNNITGTGAINITGAITASTTVTAGSLVFGTTNIDTSDSSGITITPAVTVSSDLTVENDLVVTNTVTADRFISTGTETPEISASANLNLTAGNAVVVTSSPLRMASFTTTERNALAAQNGDIIYNTTDNKFQGYENGAWANLI